MASVMRMVRGLVLACLLGVPVDALAQDRIALDPADPCGGSTGLPAIARNGRTVAVLWCWSDLGHAHDVELRFLDARTGRLQRGIVLSHAGTGGERPTAPARVRAAVARATTQLSRQRFTPMASADLAAVRAAWTSRLQGLPSHPYCCGIEDPAVQTCALPAEIRSAWTMPRGAILIEVVATQVPEGCDEGPIHQVVRL